MSGEYKTILQLVGVLSHGRVAKRLTDQAVDLMQDVQNLRKAIYEYGMFPSFRKSPMFIFQWSSYKLKVEACEKGSNKERKLRSVAVNYLCVVDYLQELCMRVIWHCRYRYGALIAFANYLIEMRKEQGPQVIFPEWLREHREITKVLQRQSLD